MRILLACLLIFIIGYRIEQVKYDPEAKLFLDTLNDVNTRKLSNLYPLSGAKVDSGSSEKASTLAKEKKQARE